MINYNFSVLTFTFHKIHVRTRGSARAQLSGTNAGGSLPKVTRLSQTAATDPIHTVVAISKLESERTSDLTVTLSHWRDCKWERYDLTSSFVQWNPCTVT